MLRFKDNKLVQLPETDMKASNLLEKNDLQRAIVDSWQEFAEEIKMDMQFIGQEVVPDDRIQDRIDILAFDSNDNIPVVIELKRRKSKFQPLQGIAYAAMISNWDQERFIGEAKRQKSPDLEDLENDLCDEDLKGKVRVVLVAEKFDPEVIIGADYLHKQFKMDILAFSFKIFKVESSLFFKFQQKYPLLDCTTPTI